MPNEKGVSRKTDQARLPEWQPALGRMRTSSPQSHKAECLADIMYDIGRRLSDGAEIGLFLEPASEAVEPALAAEARMGLVGSTFGRGVHGARRELALHRLGRRISRLAPQAPRMTSPKLLGYGKQHSIQRKKGLVEHIGVRLQRCVGRDQVIVAVQLQVPGMIAHRDIA
ncbi:hypothetical protein [Bradyrhizobium sp. 62]|uniref:hypothetical protein n=1 Tax=Bradyrhizobium sp. 62 TaxID=1043588 RepID=UPI003211B235|nr:hypothetical protein [Bradyrhizobium sp. 62]